MNARTMNGRRGVAIAAGLAMGVAVLPAQAQWTQWGGPRQDFIVETTGLASTWPDDGPPKLWSRDLGEGVSGMIVDDGTLYTLYRQGPLPNALAFRSPSNVRIAVLRCCCRHATETAALVGPWGIQRLMRTGSPSRP